MLNCATCGTVNADDSSYCRACGSRLVAPTFVQCRHCEASNPSESLYCSRCGGTMLSPSPLISPPRFKLPLGGPSSPTSPPAPPDAGRLRAPSASESLTAQEIRSNREPVSAQGLIPTHELLHMANAMGIDIDYSTLRFWQKRGLVSKPLRGPVETGRGTRGYYDASLIERIGFIREIQKSYSLGLDAIHDELVKIDKEITQPGDATRVYRERLSNLQAQRETESKRTLLGVLARVMSIPADEIAIVSVRKKDGQTVRLFTDRPLRDTTPDPFSAEVNRALQEDTRVKK